ncbi:YitT family protein [Granulicatella sp. zg-ZJ]|uniref:YczE/YyaS/YitT family protein n=1 Tax=Granulicatella sp. zg-ZJ TaxID=2678504 RepID=UPI002107147B|nr:YitT family protein [Granulicatella sp. zg-ZJ]
MSKTRQYIYLITGLLVMSLGIALFLKSGLGANPLTTFTNGVSLTVNISVGTASQLIMLSLLIVVFALDKSRIGIGTVINGVCVGIFIDMFMKLPLEATHWSIQWILLIVACVLFSMGLGLYVSSNLGEGTVDAFMIIIKNKCHVPIKIARIILDMILVGLGFLLGSNIGIGTIIGMVTTGPIMNQTMKYIKKK